MREQEVCYAFIRIDLILYSRKTVAFIFVNLVVDRPAAFFDGIHHLLRL